jgi:NADPH2:quinone reductase
MMMTDYTFLVEQPGDTSVLRTTSQQNAMPAGQQVLIRHTAIGVNFIDIYHRSGLYTLPLPFRPGVEAVGVVEAIGPEVTRLKVGDRVGYCSGVFGGYATSNLVDEERLIVLPDFISDETAAACLLKGLTAAYLLTRTFVVGNQHTLLWHAAAGGVGLIACQWAARLGARVIGTTGSEEKGELALQRGCSEVILYRHEDVAERVKILTSGRGVDVVYDSVGKDTFSASLDALAPLGMMVSFGNASGAVPDVSPLLLMQKGSLFLTRPTLSHYAPDQSSLQALADSLFAAINKGWISVDIGQRFPLYEAAKAQQELANRNTIGSTILLP